MDPISFKNVTKVLEKPEGMTDEECGPLPVFNDGKLNISLWKMSLRERFYALLFGRVWLFVFSGKTQPPVGLSVERDVFEEVND